MAAVQPPDFDPLKGHHKYQRLRHLSGGACGFVVLAIDKSTGDLVAVKLIERSVDKITKNVEREIINHSCLIHPHIVRFRECFLTPEYLGIAMEYAAGGDLYRFVAANRGLDENKARWFFQQLILALDYCHKMNISNRDIKLENTLLHSQGHDRRPMVKLCDFGYSINEDHSLAKTAVGTPGYTAPEVLLNRTRYDGKQADVWSSGVMLYAMLFCRYPFDAREGEATDNRSIVQRIIAVDYDFPPDRPVSDSVKSLLGRMLVADASQRATLLEIEQHPWFRKDMPPDLNVGTFNASYLRLSDSVEHANSIRRVVREALAAAQTSEGYAFEDEYNQGAFSSSSTQYR